MPFSALAPPPVDPAVFRPHVECLSPSAVFALRQAATDRPCWTCPIEAHGALGLIWTLRIRPGRDVRDNPYGDISVPIDPTAILDAAVAVARARGYLVAGWDLSTFLGTRAWLIIDSDEQDEQGKHMGRSTICFVQSALEASKGGSSVSEVCLWVLKQADQLRRVVVTMGLVDSDNEPTTAIERRTTNRRIE